MATAITQAVILAGGLGTRLRPITEKIPKPMAEVNGRPFLEWQLDYVKAQGISDVLLLVSYLGEKIEEHFDDGHSIGLKISYSYEPEPLGTGGALKEASKRLDEKFFLLNGDSYLEAPLRKMEDSISEFDVLCSALPLRSTAALGGPSGPLIPVAGNLKIHGGRVVAYQKGAGISRGFDHVDSGVYVIRRTILDYAPLQTAKFQLEDLWMPAMSDKRLGVFPLETRFYDIGTPERLKEFDEYLKKVPGVFSQPTGPRGKV